MNEIKYIIRTPLFSDNDELNNIENIDKDCFGSQIEPGSFFKFAAQYVKDSMLIAEDNKGIITGYILGAVSPETNESWILSLAVKPEHRRHGLASCLVNELLDLFRTKESKNVCISVSSKNDAALLLYEKLGFIKSREVANYYALDEHRIILTANL